MKKINCTTKHYDKCIIKCKNDEECTTSANDKIKYCPFCKNELLEIGYSRIKQKG